MEQKHLTRRDFLRAATITAAGAFLAACGPTPTPEVIEKEKIVTKEVEKVVEKPVEVTKVVEVEKVVTPTAAPEKQHVTIRYNEQGGRWQNWVEKLAYPRFYEEYPWITVEFEPIDWSTFPDKQLTQMAAGTAPEVLHGWSEVFQKWVSKGQLLNLNPFVETDFPKEDQDDQIPFQWDTLVYPFTGERYAIPGYVDQQILYFNKEAFDAKGVPYPNEKWTYDDYATICKSLITIDKSDQQTTWGGWYWYWAWTFLSCRIQAFGGKVRDDETWMKCLLSEPPAKEAIEWIRARIWDDKSWINNTQTAALGLSGDSAQLFATQVFSMMEADIEFWPSMAKNVKFKWDIMHVPVGKAGRKSLGDNDAFCIYKGAKDRGTADAAWKWVRFLNAPFFQRLMSFNDAVVPARKSINKEWPSILRQQWPELEPVTLEVVTNAFDMGYLVPSEQFRYQADAQPIITAALERIWQTGDAGVEILDDVCKQVNKAQDDAFKQEQG
jgi:multiple sugar transport system substrate-binding protein